MLGEKILFYRNKNNLSQEELANVLGVTEESISLWEKNEVTPSIDDLLKLSEFFGVSLDELCGNKKYENYFAKGETLYDRELLKGAYYRYRNGIRSSYIVFIVIGIIIIIQGITNSTTQYIVFGIIFSLLMTAFLIISTCRINKQVSDILQANPRIFTTYYFYNDYVEACPEQETNRPTLKLYYKDAKRIEVVKNVLYILSDKLFIAIKTENIDSKDKLLERLDLTEKLKEINGKINPRLNKFLLALFLLCIFTIFMPPIGIIICEGLSPYPQPPSSMVEHMWVFYLFLPIPLFSFVLGVIFKRKGYDSLKNIVAGVIMAFLLCIFGMFYFLGKDSISHDYGYMRHVEEVVNVDFPDEGYISIDSLSTPIAYVKFGKRDTELFRDSLRNDNRWKDSTTFIPADMLDLSNTMAISGSEYYLLYDIDSSIYNTVNSKANHRYMLLAYNVDGGLLMIIELTY